MRPECNASNTTDLGQSSVPDREQRATMSSGGKEPTALAKSLQNAKAVATKDRFGGLSTAKERSRGMVFSCIAVYRCPRVSEPRHEKCRRRVWRIRQTQLARPILGAWDNLHVAECWRKAVQATPCDVLVARPIACG